VNLHSLAKASHDRGEFSKTAVACTEGGEEVSSSKTSSACKLEEVAAGKLEGSETLEASSLAAVAAESLA
jgi:hypothetical protein